MDYLIDRVAKAFSAFLIFPALGKRICAERFFQIEIFASAGRGSIPSDKLEAGRR